MNCEKCGHSPAYHVTEKCHAWNPDSLDSKCGCVGFVEKTCDTPKEHKPWGHERKDLQD